MRIATAGTITRAISDSHIGSGPGISATDTLIITLSEAQEWLALKPKINKRSKGLHPPRPSILANVIEGAFNCVVYSRLMEIMTHFKLPKHQIRTITRFLTVRTISMCFDEQTEIPVPFTSGLPQGSSMSQVLYILYSSALISGHNEALRTETTSSSM